MFTLFELQKERQVERSIIKDGKRDLAQDCQGLAYYVTPNVKSMKGLA